MLILGKVEIGKDCFIGIHSAVAINSKMEDGSLLGDLSFVSEGQILEKNSENRGSPAEKDKVNVPERNKTPKKRHPLIFGLIFYFLVPWLGLFLFTVTIPSLALLVGAYLLGGLYYIIPALFFAEPLRILFYCLGVALFKKNSSR